jgi:hypothetical protein
MNNILQEFLGDFVFAFVDDYIVYSKDIESHAIHLQKVFDACNKANLKLKLAKCQFCKDKVTYLGHEVSKNGLRPNDDNIKKILNMRAPRSVEECRSLLGSIGFYRRFIDNFSGKAEPITKLLKKNTKFVWVKEQQDSFNYLQSSLISPPILAFPDRSQVKILTCDASTRGLSCILSQSLEGTIEGETVIAYGSKTLNRSQRNYTISHLEAMAIVWAVNRYRHYLSSKSEFVIRTDHAALVFIFKNEKPSPKVFLHFHAMSKQTFTSNLTFIYQQTTSRVLHILLYQDPSPFFNRVYLLTKSPSPVISFPEVRSHDFAHCKFYLIKHM